MVYVAFCSDNCRDYYCSNYYCYYYGVFKGRQSQAATTKKYNYDGKNVYH